MKKPSSKHLLLIPLALALIFLSFLLDSAALSLTELYIFAPLIFQILSNNLFVSVMFVLIPFLALLLKKKTKVAFLLLASVLIGYLISLGLKIVFARARPEIALELFSGANVFSLPSSHAFIVFAALPFITIALPRFIRGYWVLSLLVVLSRLVLGVHYLSDVVFGAILGLGFSHLILLAELTPHKVEKLELRRKVVHIGLGLALALLISTGFLMPWLLGVIFLFGLLLSIAERKSRIPIISKLLDLFERGDARKRFPGEGAVFYFLGAYVATLIYPLEVAAAGVIVLAIGDAVSHLLGVSIGRIKHPLNNKKFIEGWVGGLVFAFFAALIFLPAREAFIAALAGMLIEAFDITILKRRINDNVLMPVASGAAVVLFRLIR